MRVRPPSSDLINAYRFLTVIFHVEVDVRQAVTVDYTLVVRLSLG